MFDGFRLKRDFVILFDRLIHIFDVFDWRELVDIKADDSCWIIDNNILIFYIHTHIHIHVSARIYAYYYNIW